MRNSGSIKNVRYFSDSATLYIYLWALSVITNTQANNVYKNAKYALTTISICVPGSAIVEHLTFWSDL